MRVCLVIEGSYPFITGGVSSWVHQLIEGIPDTEFSLFTISPEAGMPVRYTLPANVKEHRDIVISARPKPRRSPGGGRALRAIRGFHQDMAAGSLEGLEEMIRSIRPGTFLYNDSMAGPAWDMITSSNKRNNPAYPFADYFWAWKSGHDMIFSVLGAEMPGADLYHAVSTGYAGLAAAAAKVRTGAPLVLTEHGLYHKEREMEIRRASFVRGYQRDMWIRTYNHLSRIAYRSSDVIISLFEHNRQLQIALGAQASRCVVIPNGIDVAAFSGLRPADRRPGFHVGLVGRVVPIKDIKTFISMARIVADAVPDAEFHCIGPTDEDPAYFEDCRMLVESLRLADQFHFTGRADVRAYYSFLDVVLLTSVREAQPLVILEAYCAGVPVVSTRVGNVPELLDYDERFLAPSKDPQRLAAGVRYIHEHPQEMEEIVRRNRERVLAFYDRRQLHQRYRDIYQELLGHGGNRV